MVGDKLGPEYLMDFMTLRFGEVSADSFRKMNALFTKYAGVGLHFTADETKIFAELSHGGTMKGKMGDKEPTGKEYRVAGAFRLDFQDGKIRAIKSYWDTASMIMQLGLIPPPK